eukprot:scaffold4768_cov105-Isochrysis_galbana.AAC.1
MCLFLNLLHVNHRDSPTTRHRATITAAAIATAAVAAAAHVRSGSTGLVNSRVAGRAPPPSSSSLIWAASAKGPRSDRARRRRLTRRCLVPAAGASAGRAWAGLFCRREHS